MSIMKKWLFLGLCLCVLPVFAQTTEIRFEQGTLEEAQAKAAQEKKILFIDCMGDNCGACRMMEKQVFTVPEVAEFFNTHFVNYQLNMNRPAGRAFGKRCEIAALPTLIFMDEQGEILLKELGAKQAKEFLELAQKAQRREKSDAVRFAEGERDEAFVQGYLDALAKSYLNDTFAAAFNTLYEEQGSTLLENPVYWDFFWRYVGDMNCPAALEFTANYKKYAKAYGDEAARWKIRHLYVSFARAYDLYENGGADRWGMPDRNKKLLPEKRKEYFAFMKSRKLPDVKHLQDEVDFICLTRDHRYAEAFALGEKSLQRADARRLCDWAALAERTVRGKEYRTKMAAWANRALESNPSLECRDEAKTMEQRLKELDNPASGRTRNNGSLPIRK